MITIKNITAALMCAVAPAALFAEPVELRSIDGFISVDGEIVGYNGTMVSVETSVGRVSVPASQVVCYGAGCDQVISSNDFGLTAAAFQGVVIQNEVAPAGGTDEFVVSFTAPIFDTVYNSVVGAYALTGQSEASIDVNSSGRITMENPASNELATLQVAQAGEPSNAVVSTVALKGSAPASYDAPVDWATATGLSDQLLGVRAFAVIVAPGVDVDGVSMTELAGIYAGEIKNWSELGGPDLPVLPLQLPTNSTVRAELMKLVMEPAGKSIASNVLTMADGISIASSVNQFAGAISIVSVEDADDSITLAVSGECDAPVELSDFNVISGDYPLIRPLMISFDAVPETTLLSGMFDFAAGTTAQRLIAAEGFNNLTAAAQDDTEKNRRLNRLLGGTFEENERLAAAQMFQRLFEAERLSPTMIGGTTSGVEGGWNRAMFENLKVAISGSEMAGREVMFVGFTDNAMIGGDAALSASAASAEEMLGAFMRYAPAAIAANNVTLTSVGFGGISPTTCFDGQVDNANHSRVEIWVQ
ncbi:periplasmic binding family protein [Yoonia maritima]|uniref:Periplasmic binding family protein n=1 Tax=Yoonia maritima TaxID=1435347 RepID=A0A2T0VYV2_9RHOB|nr:substrate-binding domain-containing protein [Yoonia maritima]PRY77372.1 periplasmic binding family protein [Yoonia maritima]